MQETSLKAYYEKVLPNLGQRQQQVMDIFITFSKFNFTNMELANMLEWSINRVTPRVKELRDEGLLVKACRRECSVTHNSAYAWRLNK